jgi:hypothetical protein
MYVEEFWVKDYLDDIVFHVDLCNRHRKIRKWSLFKDDSGKHMDRERELFFKFLAVCLGASHYIPQLKKEISKVYGRKNDIYKFGVILRSEVYKGRKEDYFCKAKQEYIIPQSGIIELISKERFRWKGYYNSFTGFRDLKKPFGDFAYGFHANSSGYPYQKADPDFTPQIRSSRFGTFFDEQFPLTNATAWLYKQYRASLSNSLKAASLYNTALTGFSRLLPGVKLYCCEKDNIVFIKKNSRSTSNKPPRIILLSGLPQKRINLVDFLIDFIRHMVDSPLYPNDFNLCQGVLFIDHFEKLFSIRETREAMRGLEELFPNIQFIIGCSTKGVVDRIVSFKSRLLPVVASVNRVKQFVMAKSTTDRKTWDYRNKFFKSRFCKNAPASKEDVVLIDVDSWIPNLSLMKLSRYYKNEGRNVILTRESRIQRDSKLVFASCIFNNPHKVKKMKKLQELHGENIQIGGTGVDLSLKLPNEIEYLMPDYLLYPNMDFAMGFLTRGCPKKCGFCVVPTKEGRLRQVAEIEDIVPPQFNKVVLMDNNLLAHPKANSLLEEMIRKELQINFNQTLDIRRINKKNAILLQKIDSKNYSFTKRMFYFSFNTPDMIPVIKKKLKLFDHLKPTEIRFICMYGYNTTLSDDIERFSFLQKIGTSPFVQRYKPVLGAGQPEIDEYFDTDVNHLLEIHFPQNGRIFENFLKWVSRKYVEQFGKLHMPLVDLIFKYNNRQSKHRYIASLAGTMKI